MSFGEIHYSLGLDLLLPAEGLGRWTRPDCLFVAMQQLQVLSAVAVGLRDVLEPGDAVPWSASVTYTSVVYGARWPDVLAPLGAAEATTVIQGLSAQPRCGTFRGREKIAHALLVPWLQRAGRLEQVAGFPLGGVSVLPLGALVHLCQDPAEAARLIELSAYTQVPIAVFGGSWRPVATVELAPRWLT